MRPSDRLKANIRTNAVKSVVLIVGFPFVLPAVVSLFLWVGLSTFGQRDAFSTATKGFLIVFSVVAIATVVWLPIGYMINQWIIDRATGARLLSRSEERRLWAIFENLCTSCGMRLPALRIIETEALNAYASGLSEGRYSVTITRGLLDTLNDDELEGVLAHELTHIRNHDVRLLVVATVLVGMIPILHDLVMRIFWMLVMTILNIYRAVFSRLPMAKGLVTISYTVLFWAGKGVAFVIGIVGHISSLIIHFALSRQREFMADAGAAEMTGKPEALISALRRISCNSTIQTAIGGVREMLFDSPAIFGMGGLFATHPPVEKRIEALARNAREVRRGAPPAEPVRRPSASPAASAAPAIPSPKTVVAYYGVLLRALGGSVADANPEQRQAVYRRARQAVLNRIEADSPLSKDAAEEAKGGLEAAIGRIEIEARSATRSPPKWDGQIRPERR